MHKITCRTCYVCSCSEFSTAMKIIYSLNLIFIFAVNIVFFFSGICLNSLVILSFWRSPQLRKKTFYFTIMVLSCCDFLVVLTCHPLTALGAMFWFAEKFNVYPRWLLISLKSSNIFVAFSLLAVLAINYDRYLATYYPVYHRISVTKAKILTFLAVPSIATLLLILMSLSDFISFEVIILIFLVVYFPPMLFTNYKLFLVARKCRRNHDTLPQMKKSFSLKHVSSCLLAVGCFVILSIPGFVFFGLRISSSEKDTLDEACLAGLWTTTICSMNSTFNCLIFYWKDQTLRSEGTKVIKSIKICRRVQFLPARQY